VEPWQEQLYKSPALLVHVPMVGEEAGGFGGVRAAFPAGEQMGAQPVEGRGRPCEAPVLTPEDRIRVAVHLKEAGHGFCGWPSPECRYDLVARLR
jgi:hypothetical protein